MTQIAVIGCGLWGRNIARNLAALSSLYAVHDLDDRAAQSVAEEFDCQNLSLEAILSNPDIDGVAVVTSTPSHAQLALTVLEAGKAVYVEKPLALTVQDAEHIAEQAESNRQQVMVGHLIRHHAGFKQLLKQVQTGTIGRIQHIRASRVAPGRIRASESVLFDLCPHDLALVAVLTGYEIPTRVQCHGICHVTDDIEDYVVAQLEFASGITASIEANWLNPVKIHCLTVIGDKGAMVFDDTLGWEEKLKLFKFSVTTHNGTIDLERDEGRAIPIAPQEPLKEEMCDFIEVACQNKTPLTDIREALYVQNIMARMQNDLKRSSQ